ncbi:MAG: hypothetical protein L0312_05945 [Acidobacteria bacterium]|nr:hypothetical protein [Acidobacteriota bacterium]
MRLARRELIPRFKIGSTRLFRMEALERITLNRRG